MKKDVGEDKNQLLYQGFQGHLYSSAMPILINIDYNPIMPSRDAELHRPLALILEDSPTASY